MTDFRDRFGKVGQRGLALKLVILAFVGLAVLLLGLGLLLPVIGFLIEPLNLFPGAEFDHFVHDIGFSMLFWAMIVGMAAQLRSPRRHLSSLLVVPVVLGSILLAWALTGGFEPLLFVFLGLWALAVILHPSARELRSAIRLDRANRVMLALVVIAAVPLLAFAATNVNLQTGAVVPHHAEAGHVEEIHQEHVDFGHFGLIVAFSFAVIGLGLLASFRPVGWWLTAWFVGIMAVWFGLAGVLYPTVASSPGVLWGAASILWGLAFIAAAEVTQDRSMPTPLGARRAAAKGQQ